MASDLIYDLDQSALGEILLTWNQPNYRARQVWQGLYQHYITDPEQLSNLPKVLRRQLSERFGQLEQTGKVSFTSLIPITILNSEDGATQKTLFRLSDGSLIETVLMQYEHRQTLCISTQSGCAMGCVFCATGQMGFGRHLSSGEILEQVLYYARYLAEKGKNVTNVVVMGMGEPFHNYDQTVMAIDRLNDPDGMKLGARRFTISTVGLSPVIRRFADEKRQINLAVSLHASENELRSSMLPINKKYPIEDLLDACKYYVERTHRRITFEWALIDGVNDTPEEAKRLAERLNILRVGGLPLCHVNAIPLNPTQKFLGESTNKGRAEIFQKVLLEHGIPCTVRVRRGIDIQAGCGQLAGQSSQ
jgi:23S rRNA (adenine2503-C2)-methyltransferase